MHDNMLKLAGGCATCISVNSHNGGEYQYQPDRASGRFAETVG